ncbi:MAG: hypothetical protein WD645_00250 [Dehalococcoidia bacterium]
MYEEVLSSIEKYLAGKLDRRELRDAVDGIIDDKRADDLAAQVFSGLVLVEARDMTAEEFDAEMRETVARARSAA